MQTHQTRNAHSSRQLMEQPLHPAEWWLSYWAGGMIPTARIQLAWTEAIGELISMETEFFGIYTASSRKAVQFLGQPQAMSNPIAFGREYSEIAQQIADAHIQRLNKVSQLSEDFRLQIWEEI